MNGCGATDVIGAIKGGEEAWEWDKKSNTST